MEKEMDYFIRRLTTGFVLEEGGGISGQMARGRHAFTTLKEALLFLEVEFNRAQDNKKDD